jgi:small nuclear ribonucleoprotein (snRNP)-like protein
VLLSQSSSTPALSTRVCKNIRDGKLPLTSSGDLQSVDGYMNIALERCKEVAEGRVIRSWGDAFVRGNNGTLLSPTRSSVTTNTAQSHIHLRGQSLIKQERSSHAQLTTNTMIQNVAT